MKKSGEFFASLLLAFGLLGPVTIAAAVTMPESPAMPGFSVMFASGGGTADSRSRMQRMAGEFDLLVTFASVRNDEDYREARVRVTDSSGRELLNAAAAGPLFYVQLPPGGYSVAADLKGTHLVKQARIAPHQTARVTFDWHS